MKSVAIIQARMCSNRLPGKVLMPLAGKPMLLHIVERLQLGGCCDEVVVATAVEDSNDPLVTLCEDNGISVYRGDLHDVLGRIYRVARERVADIVVRVTGDCPLVDCGYIHKRVRLIEERGLDFTYGLSSSLVFAGASVMSMRYLEQLEREVVDPSDREHCGLPYALRHRHHVRSLEVIPDPELSHSGHRLTVDEQADYEMMSHLYDALYQPGRPIPLGEAVRYLDQHPEIAALNEEVQQTPLPEKDVHFVK